MDESRWRIEQELQEGERILWSGRPRRSWYRWFLFIAVVALAFPLRIAASASHLSGTDAGAVPCIREIAPYLWTSFAVLAVVILLESPKVAFCYGVTNRRLLIVKRKARSFPLRRIGRVVKGERADGSGDLTFPKLGAGFYGLDRVADAARAVELGIASLPEEKKL